MGANCGFHMNCNLTFNIVFICGYMAKFSSKGSQKGLSFCFWAPETTTFYCGLIKSPKTVWTNAVTATRLGWIRSCHILH